LLIFAPSLVGDKAKLRSLAALFRPCAPFANPAHNSLRPRGGRFFAAAALRFFCCLAFGSYFWRCAVVSVLFCGSRSFSSFPVVQGPVSRWLSSGGGVVCGASAGADALVVRAALAAGGASSLRVLAAFASSGAGAGSCSSLSAARAASAAGAAVVWLAGGPLSVPFRARLAGRTASAAALAGGGVVFSSGGPLGPGSSLAVSCLVARGCPVWLFSPSPAPFRGHAGAWVPSVFCGLSCFRFTPAQFSFGF
jgi:hypothetical protein